MTTDKPLVSIAITTRNRKQELLVCLESCLAQDYRPIEILVFDDASEDGTAEVLQAHYPQVHLFRSRRQEGYIVLRNRGFRKARGEIVFSIDDDAYYTDTGVVRHAVGQLAGDPLVAALALPFVEPKGHEISIHPRKAPAPREVRSYRGCAHAIRREAALAVGGYREYFVHQGEERDLCIRLMDRGFSIIRGTGSPIVHMASAARDQKRVDLFGVRSTLLFDCLNVPLPYLFPRIIADACHLFFYKLSVRTFPLRFWYILLGLCACVRYAGLRKPVSWETYRLYRSRAGHGPCLLPAEQVPSPVRFTEPSS